MDPLMSAGVARCAGGLMILMLFWNSTRMIDADGWFDEDE